MSFTKQMNRFFGGKKPREIVARATDLGASFDEIYKRGLWGRKGGGSGPGSELSEMLPTVIRLSEFMHENQIDRVVDLSCGAMAWWPTVLALSKRDVHFIGLDISQEVIARNKRLLASFPGIEFRVANALTCTIDECDLLICRETLNHLPVQDAAAIVERMTNAKTRFFALSNNRFSEVNPRDESREPKFGSAYKYTEWNLSLEPFNLDDAYCEIPENKGRSLAIHKIT